MSEEKRCKTVRERQAELRARRMGAGFRQLNEWVHEEDREALVQFAKALRVRRWEMIMEARGE